MIIKIKPHSGYCTALKIRHGLYLSVEETVSFFEKLGIYPKNRNGYYYPASEQPGSLNCLRDSMAAVASLASSAASMAFFAAASTAWAAS